MPEQAIHTQFMRTKPPELDRTKSQSDRPLESALQGFSPTPEFMEVAEAYTLLAQLRLGDR